MASDIWPIDFQAMEGPQRFAFLDRLDYFIPYAPQCDTPVGKNPPEPPSGRPKMSWENVAAVIN